MDPQIISSIIIGSSTILATVLGAGTAWLIGRKISRRQKLQDDLDRAVRDIHFLLAVEEAHCARNKADGNDSFKLRTRNAVRESSDADFSGRFTLATGRRASSDKEIGSFGDWRGATTHGIHDSQMAMAMLNSVV